MAFKESLQIKLTSLQNRMGVAVTMQWVMWTTGWRLQRGANCAL
jgi:hypothetical protein